MHALSVLALLVLALSACSSPDSGSPGEPGGAASGGSGGRTSGAGGSGGTSTSCNPDILATGMTAQQTGVSVDAFDCEILKWSAHYNEPDPMIFKAIIYVESRFDKEAVGCPNLPCGQPDGWAANECGCFGLMQVVPACGPTPDGAGLLSNGHPNMTTDEALSTWGGSIFNPENNIHIGIDGIAGNRAQVKQEFPGCTEEQYTLMAIGNYNSYGSTKSCTEYNTEYVSVVLDAYADYSAASGYEPRVY